MRRRPEIRFLTVAVVLLVALAGAATVPAAAQDAPAAIDRADDDDVRIAIDSSEFDAAAENATVEFEIAGHGASVGDPDREDGRYVFRYPLSDAAADLTTTDETVEVEVTAPVRANESVDIRYVEFGPNVTSIGGRYRFEAATLGFDDGASVRAEATADDESATTEATIRATDDGSAVVFDPSSVREIPLLSGIELRVWTDDSVVEARTGRIDLIEAAEPRFAVEDRLAVFHPLIFEGAEYALRAETTGPDGRFATVAEGARDTGGEAGIVTLPASLAFAESVDVTVAREGRELVNREGLPESALAPDPVEATVSADGTVSVAPDGTVEAVWVDDGEEVRRLTDVARTDEGLRLDGYDFGNRDSYRMLLVTGAGVVRVDATFAPPWWDDWRIWTLLAGVVGPVGLLAGLLLHSPVRSESTGTVGLVAAGAVAACGAAAGSAYVSGAPAGALAGGTVASLAAAVASRDRSVGVGAYALAIGFAVAAAVVLLEGRVRLFSAVGLAGMGTVLYREIDPGLAGRLGSDAVRGTVVAACVAIAAVAALAGIAAGGVRPVGRLFAASVIGQAAVLGVATRAFAGSSSGAEPATPTCRLDVELRDGLTGREVSGDVDLTLRRTDSDAAESTDVERVVDGGGSFELDPGWWKVIPSASPEDAVELELSSESPSRAVTLELGPSIASVEVVDPNGEPIPDADVSFEIDGSSLEADEGPEPEPETTDASGRAKVAVPFGTPRVAVEVTRDRYEPWSGTIDLGEGSPTRARLRPRTGTLEVVAELDGEPAADTVIGLRATSGLGAEAGLRTDRTTDESGRARFESAGPGEASGLPVGEYEIVAEVPGAASQFSTERKRVRIEADDRSSARLSIRFEFDLRPEHRRRIRALESELDSLGSDPQRDTAIPSYFAGVVGEVLAAVERVPASGHWFLDRESAPEEVVDALLSAAEAAGSRVDYAMSATQSVDLFAACADMAPADVEWRGSVTMEEFFTLLERPSSERRKRIATRREAVEDRITRELGELSEVAPAEEMHDQINELVRSGRGKRPVEDAATAVVAIALLDAIDALFDEPPLRERMSRTVF